MQRYFQGRTQLNFTRRSSVSNGWYSTAGAYRPGSERIPARAYVFVAICLAAVFGVVLVGARVGF